MHRRRARRVTIAGHAHPSPLFVALDRRQPAQLRRLACTATCVASTGHLKARRCEDTGQHFSLRQRQTDSAAPVHLKHDHLPVALVARMIASMSKPSSLPLTPKMLVRQREHHIIGQVAQPRGVENDPRQEATHWVQM
jgi:hypothetical protein